MTLGTCYFTCLFLLVAWEFWYEGTIALKKGRLVPGVLSLMATLGILYGTVKFVIAWWRWQ